MRPNSAENTSDRTSTPAGPARGDAGAPSAPRGSMVRVLGQELRLHAPFTTMGALSGIAIMVVLSAAQVPRSVSETLFWGLHPLHVVLSALVTTGMYRLHGKGRLGTAILVGYFGSVGIATLSDCIIPYLGECLLRLPNKGIHLGFVEKWWLVNPLAAAGIALGYRWPHTKIPHAGHVLLSTWTSLFHMTMAMEGQLGALTTGVVLVFLFLAVWLPCCTSDIVFPLILVRQPAERPGDS